MQNSMQGHVTSLWRYPVKSMQGERIVTTSVSSHGLAGDRAYALIDVDTGFVVSAKHPRKWGILLQCQAAYLEPPDDTGTPPPIRITLPDGSQFTSDDPDVHERLSVLTGRRVRLIAQPPVEARREANRADVESLSFNEVIRDEPLGVASPGATFFDHAPVHIITTATLTHLQTLSTGIEFDERRFRPNIVITLRDANHGLVENTWSGGELCFEKQLVLKVLDPSPRCVVTTLPQGELSQEIGILRTIVKSSSATSASFLPGVTLSGVAGVYAAAVSVGTLGIGTEVEFSR